MKEEIVRSLLAIGTTKCIHKAEVLEKSALPITSLNLRGLAYVNVSAKKLVIHNSNQ